MTYYDEIAEGYDDLHEEEQQKKLAIIKGIGTIKKDATLLDVGCGSGISTVAFDCVATGIDPSEKLIAIAKTKRPGPTYLVGVAENLPFEDGSFDYVLSLTAIQNFDDLEKSFLEMKRVGHHFILSFLRGTKKDEEIRSLLQKHFHIIQTIEEEKDLIIVADPILD